MGIRWKSPVPVPGDLEDPGDFNIRLMAWLNLQQDISNVKILLGHATTFLASSFAPAGAGWVQVNTFAAPTEDDKDLWDQTLQAYFPGRIAGATEVTMLFQGFAIGSVLGNMGFGINVNSGAAPIGTYLIGAESLLIAPALVHMKSIAEGDSFGAMVNFGQFATTTLFTGPNTKFSCQVWGRE